MVQYGTHARNIYKKYVRLSKNHRFLALNCHDRNLISGLRNVSPQNFDMKKKNLTT